MCLSPHVTWLGLSNLEGLVGENMGRMGRMTGTEFWSEIKKIEINTWMILDMGRKGKQVSPATFVNMATKFQITYEQGICLRPEKWGPSRGTKHIMELGPIH